MSQRPRPIDWWKRRLIRLVVFASLVACALAACAFFFTFGCGKKVSRKHFFWPVKLSYASRWICCVFIKFVFILIYFVLFCSFFVIYLFCFAVLYFAFLAFLVACGLCFYCLAASYQLLATTSTHRSPLNRCSKSRRQLISMLQKQTVPVTHIQLVLKTSKLHCRKRASQTAQTKVQ